MKIVLKKSLTSSIILKTISLLLGYTIWGIIAQGHTTTHSFTVPLCFYGEQATHVIAPAELTVTLQAKRSDLRSLHAPTLGVHISTEHLRPGKNHIVLDNKSLFLPDAIKLVNYTPANIIVELPEHKA
jgi:hypothetical protein